MLTYYANVKNKNKTKNEYIVLTPCHNAAKDYYKNNLNCKVIQTWTLNPSLPLPTEKYIIIDEIGLCDREAQDLLYKCHLAEKIIYSFGDFRQLLPINNEKHFDSPSYLNYFYNEIYDMKTNYRNEFTIKYYDSLINNTVNLQKEIRKHSVKDYKKAHIIICITNKDVIKYNNLMCEYLNIDNICTKNTKIICNTNDLKNKNIYNNYDFIIKDIENDIITLDTNETITKEELLKNFTFGYAITLFKAQGQQFKSFYFPKSLSHINGRSAYTLISRLKTK